MTDGKRYLIRPRKSSPRRHLHEALNNVRSKVVYLLLETAGKGQSKDRGPGWNSIFSIFSEQKEEPCGQGTWGCKHRACSLHFIINGSGSLWDISEIRRNVM